MQKSTKLAAFSTLLAIGLLAATLQSFAQNGPGGQNSTSSFQGQTPPKPAPPSAPPDFSKATWDLPADAAKTKNPVEATDDSIAKGKELYLTRRGNCVFCHGETGSGNVANLAKLNRKPADLSNKERMSKLSDGETFWKITKGIPGIMPAYDSPRLTEEERWNVVNFVRTLAKG